MKGHIPDDRLLNICARLYREVFVGCEYLHY
jgi:hypothetical protein